MSRRHVKRLTLIRHAKSSWDHQGVLDHERPLSQRGLRDAPRMFRRMLEHGLRPQVLISSDAARAYSTAELLAREMDIDPREIRREHRLYLATAGEILRLIHELDDDWDHVALFGHNPGFTDAANRIVRDFRLDNLPTCGIVEIAFGCESWQDAAAQCASLAYFDYPKNTAAPIIR